MMVHKIIIRLDFLTCHHFIDTPGRVMKFISDTQKKFWDEIGDDGQRKITISRKNENTDYIRIQITPTYFVADMEFVKPIELEKLQSCELLIKAKNLARKLLPEFEISDFERLGIRIFSFSTINEDRNTTIQSTRKFIPGPVLDNIEAKLGNTTDVGIKLDGGSEDGRKYHLAFGPSLEGELTKHLNQFHDAISEINDYDYDFIADIDLYEEKLASSFMNSKAWIDESITIASKSIIALNKAVTNHSKG